MSSIFFERAIGATVDRLENLLLGFWGDCPGRLRNRTAFE
jgi:hypothetical protein